MVTVKGAVERVSFSPGGGEFLVRLEGGNLYDLSGAGCKLSAGGEVLSRYFALLWLLKHGGAEAELTIDTGRNDMVVKAAFTEGS